MIARNLLRPALGMCLAIAGSMTASADPVARVQERSAEPLPLRKVVLYNAGVGFYERRAEIDGNVKVDLKFNVTDVNDLLKSMVLQDLGGGRVSTVTYASLDPITKTLKTFAIDLTDNPSMGDLLDQVRGEKVEIEAPDRVTGTILGVETREQQVGDKDRVVKSEFLNLLTDAGLRSFPMVTISRIKLTDAKLDAELRKALGVLALGHATDKKTVSLNFEGVGKRPVRVGYIQQSPIWRTTYRLVLSEKKSPFLQGWALVENPTEEDWQDVSLTLVSGRPISFVMNLYQPLYVNRPIVETELFASLRPQTYGQDLTLNAQELTGKQKGMMGGMGAGMPGRGCPMMRDAATSASPADNLALGRQRDVRLDKRPPRRTHCPRGKTATSSISSAASRRPRKGATSASSSNTRSIRRFRCHAGNRPCCPLRTPPYREKSCRSTTGRCSPSIRSMACG